ncbi:DUF721 domain-containing protein [Halobacteriovorax sp. HLS]|uniref:DUF721 domain-containing protein n=1 Tax=Halobacteriovorax sp. HLS TaxID=2234000 RepID=UPI0013E29BB0|nr:DUF721 domain-containing protein [Halobacteriovorax sp. HLS]
MKKESKFTSLKSIFEQFSTGGVKEYSKDPRYSKSKYIANETFDFFALIEAWPEIVGPRIGKYTIPLKNQNNCLTVLTNHSAFSQELGFLEEEIKNKIITRFNSLKGKISRINFIYNSHHFTTQVDMAAKFVKNKPKEREVKEEIIFHKFSPQYKKLKAQADELFNDLDDLELKESLTSIFIQNKSK